MPSCNTNDEPTNLSSNTKIFTVSLGLSGEISNITNFPLSPSTRSGSSDDLYGIQVYSTPVSGGTETPYAYGLFDNTESMNIKLMSGYKYRFECAMMPNGKNELGGGSSNSYNTPFSTTNDNGSATQYTLSTFEYRTDKKMKALSQGAVYYGTGSAVARPKTDRYYGTFNDYIPSEGGTVSINMKRQVFGVKVIADGLTEGKLQIQLEGAPLAEIIAPATEIQNVYTFKNISSPIINNGTTDIDYYEDIPVVIVWQKADGVNVPIATQTIRFTRKTLTQVTVKVQDNNINNGIGITLESNELVNGESILIGGSPTTDTPIQ